MENETGKYFPQILLPSKFLIIIRVRKYSVERDNEKLFQIAVF